MRKIYFKNLFFFLSTNLSQKTGFHVSLIFFLNSRYRRIVPFNFGY